MTTAIAPTSETDTPNVGTINAHRLSHLLSRVQSHVSTDEIPVIAGIHLEADGTTLFAVATDRFTFAAARTRHQQTTPWEATIPADGIKPLRGWLNIHDGATPVSVDHASDSVSFTSEHGTFRLATVSGEFPAWRPLFRTAMERPLTEVTLGSWNTNYLARWRKADWSIHAWTTGPNKPLVISASDFLGLQMPLKYQGTPADPTCESIAADWAATLGTGESAELADVLPAKPRISSAARTVADLAEELLRQTIRSGSDAYDAPSEDPGALVAHIVAGGNAWIAYRLLYALRTADPEFAVETVADIGDQLDSGEIAEWAWDAAKGLGHDPDAWHQDYEERKAARLAKKAAASVAVAVETTGEVPA